MTVRLLKSGFITKGVIILGLIVGLPGSSSSDQVILKSGKMIEGKLVEETSDHVKVNFRDVVLTYYRDEIETVRKESRNPLPAAPARETDDEAFLLRDGSPGIKRYVYRVQKMFSFQVRADVFSFHFAYPVPRDDIPRQKVRDVETSPEPSSYDVDAQGFTNASFQLLNVKKGTRIDIKISYIVEITDARGEFDPGKIPVLSQSVQARLGAYLMSEEHSPSDMKDLRAIVAALVKGEENPYRKARALYQYLVGHMRYLDKPASDPVQSPSETFSSQRGNCVDLSLLFVDLSRAGGIPARLVSGIVFQGDDPDAKFISQEGHTWAEIFLPGYGWLPVDPTFGLQDPQESFCFPYRRHIREFYGQFFLRDSGTVYRGSLDIRGWPMQKFDQAPVEQQNNFVIEPLFP